MVVPEAIVDDALGGWGSPSSMTPPNVRTAYVIDFQGAAALLPATGDIVSGDDDEEGRQNEQGGQE